MTTHPPSSLKIVGKMGALESERWEYPRTFDPHETGLSKLTVGLHAREKIRNQILEHNDHEKINHKNVMISSVTVKIRIN